MSSLSTEQATLVHVPMPQMGTSVVEGTVIAWRKQVGDVVEVDEVLCDISTDKVDTECPSPVAGTLAEVLVTAGETVEVGTVIARIAVSGSAIVGAAPATAGKSDTQIEAAVPEDGNGAARARPISPVVARMAAAYGIDLDTIAGSGRRGRVTKADVVRYLEERNGTEPAAA